ncbi:MAG: hypothetical protein JWO82_3503 [Akkermansiaceae bacterium]|nr:hypothetical protein [Akkermansiaceae bacterium]
MAAGTTISGQDGVIKLGGASEVPMLTDWAFDAKSDIKTLDTRVMKSNADGGSAAAGGFDKKTLGSRGASFNFTHQWQENDAAGAMALIRTTAVGSMLTFELYPNNTTSGKRKLAGSAYISAVGDSATVDGVVTQKVSCEVDGAWTDTALA